MRYTPRIKGKTLKKSVRQPTPLDLAQNVGSVAALVHELNYLKDDIIATVDKELEKIDEKIVEVDAKVESVMDIKQGPPGIDADEQKIADWVMGNIRVPEDGEDGKDADEKKIIDTVLSKLPKIDEKKIIDKIASNIPKASLKIIQEKLEIDVEKITGDKKFKIRADQIEGFEQTKQALRSQIRQDIGYVHGGGDTVAAGTNVTITTNANGDKVINSSGGITGLTVGATTITGGATTRILYDNAGVLGEYTITGTGTVVAMQTNPTLSGITMTDATNIVLNATTGTKIGTATTQKLGFFNSVPIVQPTGDVITALQNLGLGTSLTVAASSIVIGNAVTGGGVNMVLYEDASQNLAASANFIYTETSGPRLQVGSGATTSAGWVLGYGASSSVSEIWSTSIAPSTTNYSFASVAGQTTIINGTDTGGGSVQIRMDGGLRFSQGGTAGLGPAITAGTATTDVNALSITQTWNNAGVAFTGIKATFTTTAKAVESKYLDIRDGSGTVAGIFNRDAANNTMLYLATGAGAAQSLYFETRNASTGAGNISGNGLLYITPASTLTLAPGNAVTAITGALTVSTNVTITGNVGIGVSPTAQLDVLATSNSASTVMVTFRGSGNGKSEFFQGGGLKLTGDSSTQTTIQGWYSGATLLALMSSGAGFSLGVSSGNGILAPMSFVPRKFKL